MASWRQAIALHRDKMVLDLVALQLDGVISETTIDPQRLWETMARNRGVNVKVFTALPDAMEWLGREKQS